MPGLDHPRAVRDTAKAFRKAQMFVGPNAIRDLKHPQHVLVKPLPMGDEPAPDVRGDYVIELEPMPRESGLEHQMEMQAFVARVVDRDPGKVGIPRTMPEQVAQPTIERVLGRAHPGKLEFQELRVRHVELEREDVMVSEDNPVLGRVRLLCSAIISSLIERSRHVWTPLWEQEKSSGAVWPVVGC